MSKITESLCDHRYSLARYENYLDHSRAGVPIRVERLVLFCVCCTKVIVKDVKR